jgi:hypothetical protein
MEGGEGVKKLQAREVHPLEKSPQGSYLGAERLIRSWRPLLLEKKQARRPKRYRNRPAGAPHLGIAAHSELSPLPTERSFLA